MRNDQHVRERRARLRALQADEPEPYDWAEALRFWAMLLLWGAGTLAAGFCLAWLLGAGLDRLEALFR